MCKGSFRETIQGIEIVWLHDSSLVFLCRGRRIYVNRNRRTFKVGVCSNCGSAVSLGLRKYSCINDDLQLRKISQITGDDVKKLLYNQGKNFQIAIKLPLITLKNIKIAVSNNIIFETNHVVVLNGLAFQIKIKSFMQSIIGSILFLPIA